MKTGGGLRVLVVDDSPFTRQVIRGILAADPAVGEVEGAANGKMALDAALRRPPDVVVLDLHMPVMDGFTFLRLFRARSQAPVLVVSSDSDRLAVEAALSLGAAGFVPKPGDPYRKLGDITEELQRKVRQHATADLSLGPTSPPAPGSFPVIAIGSSSGGPSTVEALLTALPSRLEASVMLAQHMPAGFTEAFARRLDRLLAYPVREAADGDPIRPGEVLVAPGGKHMAVSDLGGVASAVIESSRGERCVPSVDRLLETAARVFGGRLTAVILTGMGNDGSSGVRAVKTEGGRVIAESERTAAIFGMPRKAAATGCVDELLPLPEIAERLSLLLPERRERAPEAPGEV